MTLLERLPELDGHTDEAGHPLCNKGLHYLTDENRWGPNDNRCVECRRETHRISQGRPRRLRYPFAPIDALLGYTADAEIAARLGVVPKTVRRWRRDGLNEFAADRVAVALGLTPHLIVGWEHYEEAL